MPATSPEPDKASFAEFFFIWADGRGWDVPDIHWRAVHWLEHCADLAVLRCFRGFGKSTILGIYNAWRYYRNPAYRILHQGADDQMAYKTSRDTQFILRNHPLTLELLPSRPGPVEQWWVKGAPDVRNASMFAKGITSTTTSSRADECQNDDVEVPKNISNPEAREKMRARLGEQVHIMVPSARQLFIGTPHTHDSLYDEMQRLGADCLTIRMFAHEHRVDRATQRVHEIAFAPDWIFVGIGGAARLLKRGADYTLTGTTVTLKEAPGCLVDFYAGAAWPERFDGPELLKRRRKTRTINEWDSQYQLHSRPVTETRLDPDRLKAYEVEPVLRKANGETGMWLGGARIVGASCKWDPSSGKLKSDISSLGVVLQDEQGRRYWHRAVGLVGEVAETDAGGEKIIGGQVLQIVAVIKELALPRVVVETNGIGTFAPAFLKAALKQAGLLCGVTERHESNNKNRRILEAVESPLMSGALWAHVSVLDGPAFAQMRDWNPAVADQPDDHLDTLAGAISQTPERIGRAGRDLNPTAKPGDDWRPSGDAQEVELEF